MDFTQIQTADPFLAISGQRDQWENAQLERLPSLGRSCRMNRMKIHFCVPAGTCWDFSPIQPGLQNMDISYVYISHMYIYIYTYIYYICIRIQIYIYIYTHVYMMKELEGTLLSDFRVSSKKWEISMPAFYERESTQKEHRRKCNSPQLLWIRPGGPTEWV